MILCLQVSICVGQKDTRIYYYQAFDTLQAMLTDNVEANFKRAVFLTENAYMDNAVRYEDFDLEIQKLVTIVNWFKEQSALKYSGRDSVDVAKWAALFTIVTQEMLVPINDTTAYLHHGFKYDFDDIWGEKEWTKQFVTKLLYSGQGNCHSLPFLYKILADEIGTTAYLALAPHHVYVKHRSEEWGWYNTELTSATFPIDAWITASSYINFDAIRSKMYMDTLSLKQSIGMSLVDLAEGYKRKFANTDLDFILKCTDTALKYDPTYANALLLKAETMKKKFDGMMSENGAAYPSDLFSDVTAKALFEGMESTYGKLLGYGYQTMPKEMYMQWLTELKEEKEKYLNKNIITNFNTDDQSNEKH